MDSILHDLESRRIFSVQLTIDKKSACFADECDVYFGCEVRYAKHQVQ